MRKFLLCLSLAPLGLAACTERAFGQSGDQLYGSAAVMNAYGNLTLQQEQARIVREAANQAKLVTRLKAFELRRYEKANTPTFGQEQRRLKDNLQYRILNNATEAEIASGKAQNVLAPLLRFLADRGIQGPPVKLDPDMLQQINVTAGNNETGFGLLRAREHMDWPPMLRGPTQRKVAELIQVMTDAAARGRLDRSLYDQVSKGVTRLGDELKKQFYTGRITGTAYLTGKRFLESLEGSVDRLQQPGASKFLTGHYAARGRTVQELVRNMARQGLRFAPASPGSEPAYRALYNAMVSSTAGAETVSGFRAQGARVAPGSR